MQKYTLCSSPVNNSQNERKIKCEMTHGIGETQDIASCYISFWAVIDYPKGHGIYLVFSEKWKLIFQKAILILHDVIKLQQLKVIPCLL